MSQGFVVLPGLDKAADDETWEALGPTHPQYALKGLLARLGVSRRAVSPWPSGEAIRGARTRSKLVADALRPAETTTGWRTLPRLPQRALEAFQRIDCASPQEEAGVIAIIMRQQLDTPARTAALVTADRVLARRVTAELRRWEIEVDDSAGTALGDTVPGTFLRLTAQLAAENAAPVPLLAALKHPLAAGGGAPVAFRQAVRRLERAVLRGPRPTPGIAGLRAALDADDTRIGPWLDDFDEGFRSFAAMFEANGVDLRALLAAHVRFTEWLATTDSQAGTERLWSGAAGEDVARFVAELAEAAPTLPPLTEPGRYPALLDALMEGRVVRPPFRRHPRLQIWGPLEARLQRADCVILGGLNEGTWPPEAEGDPWMSRPMRAAFGLPPLEARIGLSAHDFAQCCGAEQVFLTRASRVDGTPLVPSRWLARIDAVLDRLVDDPDAWRAHEQTMHAWWAALDRPAGRPVPWLPPAPTPPVEARPRRLSVTRVETWIGDPYSIYARNILRLEPLDPIDADPSAAERGIIIHRILENFVRAHPDALPADAEKQLLALGHRLFKEAGTRPGVLAFWWPRLERIAAWFVATERARRVAVRPIAMEVSGSLTFEGPAGPFILTAKADRIDRTASGALEIIDYKTGATPTQREVASGQRPQLSLEAAISVAGGFEGVAPAPVDALAYWKLSGAETAGEIITIRDDPTVLAREAEAGLRGLVARFDDPTTPYHPVPRPVFTPRWNDYAHLARLKEWSVPGEETR
jgi:ATP-dependent helicase/nuclease subunit B